jgi:hypothetical protein
VATEPLMAGIVTSSGTGGAVPPQRFGPVMITAAEISQRLEKEIVRFEARAGNLRRSLDRVSIARNLVFLVVFLSVVILHWEAMAVQWIVLGTGTLLFGFLAFRANRRKRESIRCQKWIEWKRDQLSRVRLDWSKIEPRASAVAGTDHPFAWDLDLVGDRSLHQLLDITVSQEGSRRLEELLCLQESDRESVLRRQSLVSEMARCARFYEKLILTFRLHSNARIEGQRILEWLDAESTEKLYRKALSVSLGLFLGNITVLGILLFTRGAGNLPEWVSAYLILYLSGLSVGGSWLRQYMTIGDELSKLLPVLAYVERFPYRDGSVLKHFCSGFLPGKGAPSLVVRRTQYLVSGIGLRMNIVMGAMLNLVLPWDTVFIFLLQVRKAQIRDLMRNWLKILSHLEAFACLANHASLHPDACFPVILPDQERDTEGLFGGEAIGHPLLRPEAKVRNDFHVKNGQVILVSGSNMSGKSTFLRTIGVNLCLAFAGGPADATSLHVSPLRIFACLQHHDSLVDGLSGFYAQIKRLKQMMSMFSAGEASLLYLIDEIFQGTNNRERLIGSRSFIRSVAAKNGAGIISTHDEDLTKMAESIPEVKNYHFSEDVSHKELVFDYRLRPGPCPTTNALKIMRMEGLPVDSDTGGAKA